MRVVFFCHSLVSDWNHGNAHFLRGVVQELLARGHTVVAYEPSDGWSRTQLVADQGSQAVDRFHDAFPMLRPRIVDLERIALDEALDDADVVLVHEWNSPSLVERIGAYRTRSRHPFTLLFHDTHHRSVSDVEAMSRYRLDGYDGVLAFGEVIRERYLRLGWSRRVWTWHEAADTRVFSPLATPARQDDLVWIGNWGDDERSAELRSFLVAPARDLRLSTTLYGVRYPDEAVRELASAGLRYAGWLANYRAPAIYAGHRMTMHVPRRPYVEALPGIPTIRVFEALACGIPLVSLRWHDVEGLFTEGEDFLMVDTPEQMRQCIRDLREDAACRREMADHGLATIRRRHTCAHRVDELEAIVSEIRQPAGVEAACS